MPSIGKFLGSLGRKPPTRVATAPFDLNRGKTVVTMDDLHTVFDLQARGTQPADIEYMKAFAFFYELYPLLVVAMPRHNIRVPEMVWKRAPDGTTLKSDWFIEASGLGGTYQLDDGTFYPRFSLRVWAEEATLDVMSTVVLGTSESYYMDREDLKGTFVLEHWLDILEAIK